MKAGKRVWQNRKERKEWARRLRSEDPGLEVVHPHAAGIDVGEQYALSRRAAGPGSRTGKAV
ncbi:MAG: hypothetical protein JO159_02895 [Acidobacteria bacterium]|nr:hypothetical protein [Acidobacteriota bacterium]